MTQLRLIEEADIPEVLAAGREHIASSNYAPMGFDDEKAAGFIRHLIVNGLAVVAVEEGQITGGILGDVIEPWYSTNRMGVEHVLYVLPQHRGGRAALMLVRAWVKWCLDSGATQIRPGVSTGCEAAEAFYERLGFKRAGGLFVMDRGPG